MASVGDISLTITPDPESFENAIVKIEYTISGSPFDVASGQPYGEVASLVGVDTPFTLLEDGTDDFVQLIFVQKAVVFTSTDDVSRSFSAIVNRALLNEDAIGTDELVVRVRLTPHQPQTVTKDSNQVAANF